MLVLHVSDTHLGAMPYGLISRAKDIYEAFKETIDIALRERVSVYLHAGDFFDSPNPLPESYVIAYRELRKLKEAGIRVVIIAGQHDTPRRHSVSPLYLLQDLGVVDMLAINSITSGVFRDSSLNVSIYAVPHGLKSSIHSIAVSREGQNRSVLVAHLLLKEIGIPSEEADVSLSQIPRGFTYIALGDYHMKTEFRHVDGAPAVYPGATEIHKENECCDKYVAFVDLSAEKPAVSFIKLKSVRPWIRIKCVDVSTCMRELSSIRRVEGVKKPIVSIDLQKIRVETIAKILSEMVSSGVIEYYRIKVAEDSDALESSIPRLSDAYEYLDLGRIVRNMVRHEGLAQLLLRYVKEPSKQVAEDIVQYLKNNTDAVKALETNSTHNAFQYGDSEGGSTNSSGVVNRKTSTVGRALQSKPSGGGK